MPLLSKMAKIPLNLDETVILIEALFSGRRDAKPLKMILDTGATITTIPNEIAIAIGCDPAKSTRRIELITASGTEYAPVITVPKVEFLGITLHKVEAICHNLPPQSLGSGLLGLNILKNFDVLLKFRAKILEILG
jgi:clan AA aspartic protease (TIGR02281 family)